MTTGIPSPFVLDDAAHWIRVIVPAVEPLETLSPLDRLIAGLLPLFPRRLVWKVARRYIAGQSLEEALECVRNLARYGCRATLDILGEDVHDQHLAAEACGAYVGLIERIHEANLPAGISIKLSQLGIRFSPADARRCLQSVLLKAQATGRFVRIDMEDSSLTSTTIDMYREFVGTCPRLGLVLQAYLKRSVRDLEALLPLRPDVRICKGIYREPPAIAFTDRHEVRKNFLRLLDLLLENGGTAAIATHDPFLVNQALARLRHLPEAERDRHECQMLLGVGEKLWRRINDRGVRLRIYVPFGSNWYAYSMRRLRENPTIARYVVRNFAGSRSRRRPR